MRHLQTYESRINFNIGDLIIYNEDVYDKNNIIIKANYPYKLLDVKGQENEEIGIIKCDDGMIRRIHLNDVRKITKKEAKALLDSEIYNL